MRAAIDLPEEERDELRDLANDLCLKTDGRMSKDDVKVLEAWALKVREAYLDAQARRKDADEATEERVETLRQAFELFKEIKPKDVVGDERLFRELHDRFGSDWGFGVYFGGGMGAEAIRELLRREDLDTSSSTCARRSRPRRASASSARSSASRSCPRSASPTTSRTGWCSTRSR